VTEVAVAIAGVPRAARMRWKAGLASSRVRTCDLTMILGEQSHPVGRVAVGLSSKVAGSPNALEESSVGDSSKCCGPFYETVSICSLPGVRQAVMRPVVAVRPLLVS
jgi:hypothetical protein